MLLTVLYEHKSLKIIKTIQINLVIVGEVGLLISLAFVEHDIFSIVILTLSVVVTGVFLAYQAQKTLKKEQTS